MKLFAVAHAKFAALAALVRSCRLFFTYKIYELRVSAFGRAVGAGMITFLAGCLGSILADSLSHKIAAVVGPLFAVTPSAVEHTARLAGLTAAAASGITSVPAIARSAFKEKENHPAAARMVLDLATAFTAGYKTIKKSGMTALAAAFIGGSFAALLPSGFSAAITAGVSAAIASVCGAMLTTGLGAMSDSLLKSARARAKAALKTRKEETSKMSQNVHKT